MATVDEVVERWNDASSESDDDLEDTGDFDLR